MKAGKVSEAVLKRSVLKLLRKKRGEVILGSSVGEDGAAFSFQEELAVLTTNPVIGSLEAPQILAERVVLRAVNNLVATGADPVSILVNVLFPTECSEPQLRSFMQYLENAAMQAGIQIAGGHTEITREVRCPVITVTGIGKTPKEGLIPTSGAKPGMDIIITRWIAMEATVRLVQEKEGELRTRYSVPFLEKAKSFEPLLMLHSEAAAARRTGVSAMHDVSEGGIFAALWEMAEASGVGLEVDLKKIPIRQETVEISEFFGLNPYKMTSNGCLLMVAENGNAVVSELQKEGIGSVIVGKTTDGNDRILRNEEEVRFLETPQADELYSVL